MCRRVGISVCVCVLVCVCELFPLLALGGGGIDCSTGAVCVTGQARLAAIEERARPISCCA